MSLYIGLAIKGEGFYCKYSVATATTSNNSPNSSMDPCSKPPWSHPARIPLGAGKPLENPKRCWDDVTTRYHPPKSQTVLNYRLI